MRLEKGVVHYGRAIFNKSKDLCKALPADKMKRLWNAISSNKNTSKLNSKSVINRDLLYHQLHIQEKMGEVGKTFAGKGTDKLFRNEDRIVKQYGGEMGEWNKKTSSNFTTKSGQKIELHWVENVKTGKRVEYKQKLLGK